MPALASALTVVVASRAIASQVCPTLRKRKLYLKQEIPLPIKAERVAVATQLLGFRLSAGDQWLALRQFLSRVNWIDSKKLYVVPGGQRVWAPADAQLTVECPHLPKSGKVAMAINYYVVVNAVLGPVMFKVVTGTTDFVKLGGRHYMVSGMQATAYIVAACVYDGVL